MLSAAACLARVMRHGLEVNLTHSWTSQSEQALNWVGMNSGMNWWSRRVGDVTTTCSLEELIIDWISCYFSSYNFLLVYTPCLKKQAKMMVTLVLVVITTSNVHQIWQFLAKWWQIV